MDFIKNPIVGGAIHTYPNRDLNQDKVYEACKELEKRGQLERKIDEPNHVLFVIKKNEG